MPPRAWLVPALVVGLFAAASSGQAAPKAYTVKVEKADVPREVPEAVAKQLGDRSVKLLDGKGEVVYEVWFAKSVEAKATDAQIKNGLTYAEVPESTVLGVLRAPKGGHDYRKQALKAGTYTLRLGQQPMDGDHMGTAPYSTFALASPAADDKKAGLLSTKALNELSAKATGAHPCVWLLFPGGKEAAAEPKLLDKGEGHLVVVQQLDVTVGEKKTTLGVGLTLVGHSAAAE